MAEKTFIPSDDELVRVLSGADSSSKELALFAVRTMRSWEEAQRGLRNWSNDYDEAVTLANRALMVLEAHPDGKLDSPQLDATRTVVEAIRLLRLAIAPR